MRNILTILVAVLFLCTLATADVKMSSTSTLKFEGAFGTMMKLFGAGKPVKSADYYKDNQKRSDTFDKKDNVETSQIVDLDKELFITVNYKDKEYTQMTFQEWKEMMQAAMKDVEEKKAEAAEQSKEGEATSDVKWDFKMDVQKTGEKADIAGRTSEKVILTLEVEAEATSTEQGQQPETAKGSIIVTSNNWLYSGDDRAQKEMNDFNRRFAEKLGLMIDQASAQQMMAQIFATNPQLGEAMKKMQEEGDKLQGVPMRMETVYESKADPETVKKMQEEKAKQQQEESTEIPTSVGGLIGGLGKKALKKQLEKKDEGPKDRSTLMTSMMEVNELDTAALSSDLFQAPAGFKLVKTEQQK